MAAKLDSIRGFYVTKRATHPIAEVPARDLGRTVFREKSQWTAESGSPNPLAPVPFASVSQPIARPSGRLPNALAKRLVGFRHSYNGPRLPALGR